MTGYEPPTVLPPELLKRPDLVAALAEHDFGTVFVLARAEAGISYSAIAAECGIKPERVGTLARGRGRITSFEKIVRIADALRIPGHMVGLAARPWETTPEPALRPGADRREFLKTTAAASLAVGLPDLTRPTHTGRIGSDVPDRLRRRTARLRRLDDVLGGGDTYRTYLGEYQDTRVLLRRASYSEETGRGLLSVLAEQAQQAGWAAFDGGRHAEAQGLYEASHRAAVDAGDDQLAGNALAHVAYQQLPRDRQAGVQTAARSCATAGPDAAPQVRALLYERLAWAHAVAGQADETERALSAARDALADVDDAPQPDWASWVDETELQIMSGRCWTVLRRPLRAVPVLEEALAQYDDSHARDKALYLSWLADSYLAASEPEQAAVIAGRALDLATGVASVRPRAQLEPVLQRLGEHRALPAAADVLERACG
ncbi:helix-turn-helix domain-containing protein [Streptomyces beihaiensis]|uniref:Helix-turn-helix domain-containing protein n=1 Tax=Streptomyces beihaiensis TaxID=2984495 RepID=A0ABT3TYU3_9ACTN|nr:helix-turn-helix transcriptional regulator [Streptomyces beihaiensis]MCX3062228.1 helix-turn-helix domain-containing protein [Streptomyces beihaiensis]